MKRGKNHCIFLCAVLSLSLLVGCGREADPGKSGAASDPAKEAAVSADPRTEDAAMPGAEDPSAVQTLPKQHEKEEAPRVDENGLLHVSSVEELVEAIHPQAAIVIEPGRYNLSEYLSSFTLRDDWDAWNEEHEYIHIQESYDGLELTVLGVNGLLIEGGSDGPADTELVIEPRYARVLSFIDCENVTLARLTMGHTYEGDCNGNVLDFSSCRKIRLSEMDLYGCGAYGIGVTRGTGDLEVSDSTIRDCAYGPFDIRKASGTITFTDCKLSGSRGGGSYDHGDDSALSLVRCTFGINETNRWHFELDATVTIDDCRWTYPTELPDVDPDDGGAYPDFDLEGMVEKDFPDSATHNVGWTGYAVVDPQSGETQYLSGSGKETADGGAFLFFDEGHTGWLEYRGETFDFLWDLTDDDLLCLSVIDNGMNLYVSLFQSKDADDWMMLQYDNDLIWFYQA